MKNNLSKFLSIFIITLSCNNIAVSQGYCYPDQSDTYWKISESLYGSKKLSGCAVNAYYNCHGFMMSYFEDTGCSKPGWNNPVATPYTCPSDGITFDTEWKNSGRYVRVCAESVANIAYYHFPNEDTHSAVKEIIPGGAIKYISKYGSDGPLVAHNLTGSWYHLSGQFNIADITRQFWSYVGYIQGSTTITGTSPVTFSVNNISTVIYSWSIVSGCSNIVVSSGGNQSTVTLAPAYSGTSVLQLNISSACGSVKTQQIILNITTTDVCLEGTYDNAGIYNQNLNTTNHVSVGGVFIRVSCPNSTSITWQKTSGNINGYFPPGSTTSFDMTSGGSISFLVTAKNGSTTLATRNITFYNYY
ncbi:MAG: hypothetical protein J7K53_00740 [Bacteroidales bacterium]|nr:hypothetical protein [Bacteroidales bacterium]